MDYKILSNIFALYREPLTIALLLLFGRRVRLLPHLPFRRKGFVAQGRTKPSGPKIEPGNDPSHPRPQDTCLGAASGLELQTRRDSDMDPELLNPSGATVMSFRIDRTML